MEGAVVRLWAFCRCSDALRMLLEEAHGVARWPGPLASNPGTGTVYVADNVDGEASLFGYANGFAFP